MYCTICGREIPEGARYCVSCGAQISRPNSVTDEQPAATFMQVAPTNVPTASTRRVPVAAIALGIALAVALTASAVYFLVIQPSGPSDPDAVSGANGTPLQASATKQDEHRLLDFSYETTTLQAYGSNYGPDSGKPQFSYVQFTCSEQNDVIDELNKSLEEDVRKAYSRSLDNAPEFNANQTYDEPYYAYYKCQVTYFSQGIACVIHSYYSMFPGAVHGLPMLESRVIDLTSGAETTAAEYVGATDLDVRIMAWKAVDTFLRTRSDLYESATDAFPRNSSTTGIPAEAATFYLVPDGVAAWFGPYVLGSFAFGTPSLLVCDPEGNAIAMMADYPLQPEERGSMTVETRPTS